MSEIELNTEILYRSLLEATPEQRAEFFGRIEAVKRRLTVAVHDTELERLEFNRAQAVTALGEHQLRRYQAMGRMMPLEGNEVSRAMRELDEPFIAAMAAADTADRALRKRKEVVEDGG